MTELKHIFSVLGDVKFCHQSAKDEVSELRIAMGRIPINTIVFNREFKNKVLLHSYLYELEIHNRNIV